MDSRQCDSGINSLVSKEENIRPSYRSTPGDYEKLLKDLRERLGTDCIPRRRKSQISQTRNVQSIIVFTETVIDSLKKCLASSEGNGVTNSIFMRWKPYYDLLRWKIATMNSLLTEYKELFKNCEQLSPMKSKAAKSKNSPFSFGTTKSRFTSLFSVVRDTSSNHQGVSTLTEEPQLHQNARLNKLECHLGDLAGCLSLRLQRNSIRGQTLSLGNYLKIHFQIIRRYPTEPISLLDNSSQELQASTDIKESVCTEWIVDCTNGASKPSSHPLNELEIPGSCMTEYESFWNYSSSNSILSIDAGSSHLQCLLKNRSRNIFPLATFLMCEPTTVTVELTCMSSPYIELEVEWLPFSNLDEELLQLYPPILLQSTGSIHIDRSPSCITEKQIIGISGHSHFNSPSPCEVQCDFLRDQGSDIDVEPIVPVISEAENDLENLIRTTKDHIEHLVQTTNCYTKLLKELDSLLKDLCRIFKTLTFNKTELHTTLDFLDQSIESSAFNNSRDGKCPVKTPMTGWEELDSAIKWHFKNVSLLLKHLKASDRIYTDDNRGANFGSLRNRDLCIREDLIVMTLKDQFDILSDITSMSLNLNESKNIYHVVSQSHFLDYGGIQIQKHLQEPLLPRTFWSSLVWKCDYINRSQIRDTSIEPVIMIGINDLQSFIQNEFGVEMVEEDELENAIGVLIEQLCDTDLTYNDVGEAIPLTQICHRLKLTDSRKIHIPAAVDKRKYRGRDVFQVDPQKESSLGLAIQYIVKQAKLQNQLRSYDSDQVLEVLEDLAYHPTARPDLSQQLETVSISVTSVICLAFTLENDDENVTKMASRAICEIDQYTANFYGIHMQTEPLPFLRSSGPCNTLLNNLEQFATLNAKKQPEYRRMYRPAVNSSSYKLLTPFGACLLWGMHPDAEEDIRLVAVKAWKCLIDSTGMTRRRNKRQGFQKKKKIRSLISIPFKKK